MSHERTERERHQDKVDAPSAEFKFDAVDSACEEALFGGGVAFVESLGTDQDEREALVSEILKTDSVVGNGSLTETARYYSEFDDDTVVRLLSPILEAMGEQFPDYFVANMQYIQYLPGDGLAEHFDFGDETTALGSPQESITFIWVLRGHKELIVWPKKSLSQKAVPKRIQQSPDMLLVLRGGAFEHNTILYPAIKHEVPAVSEESGIFTFELAKNSSN